MLFLKGSSPMMFGLLLDAMERPLNLRDARLPWKELYRRCEIARHKFEAFYQCAITSDRIGAHTDTDHIRLGGDGSLGWRCPRHFVPGYGRTVPPGQALG